MITRSLKKHNFSIWIITIPLILGLSGCQHYPITLNGSQLNSKPLLTGFNLADKHLMACVNEHIFDRHISKAEQLIELNCAERSIRSLKGLEYFPHLLRLRLNNNPIDSFKPLLALTNLEQLDVSDNATDCTSLLQLRQRGVKLAGACAGNK